MLASQMQVQGFLPIISLRGHGANAMAAPRAATFLLGPVRPGLGVPSKQLVSVTDSLPCRRAPLACHSSYDDGNGGMKMKLRWYELMVKRTCSLDILCATTMHLQGMSTSKGSKLSGTNPHCSLQVCGQGLVGIEGAVSMAGTLCSVMGEHHLPLCRAQLCQWLI
jgi:hypothetical protein